MLCGLSLQKAQPLESRRSQPSQKHTGHQTWHCVLRSPQPILPTPTGRCGFSLDVLGLGRW